MVILRSKKEVGETLNEGEMKADENGQIEENEASQKPGDKYEMNLFGFKFNTVIAVTHVNIFLYATCFWIQTGALPVSIPH